MSTKHLSASTHQQPPMIVDKETIERLAQESAQQRQPLRDACPFPFGTEAGQHFEAVYLLALPVGVASEAIHD